MTYPAQTPPPVLEGYGLRAQLPGGWEGRIYHRPTPTARRTATAGPEGGVGWAGEVTTPALHAGNFALPADRGDFGTGAIDRMGSRHAFVALLEFGPEEAGTALYPPVERIPRPAPSEFNPQTLQQALPGLLGYQRFFTYRGRALCLFVVLGSTGNRVELTRQVNGLIDGIEVA